MRNTIHPGLIASVLAGLIAGCQEREAPSPEPTAARETEPEASAWRTIAESPQVAIPERVDDEAMQAAIDEARRTVDDARRRWAAVGDRDHWAVKWAAPTEDGGTEYVWVVPASWSAFRIEGRLASPPQRPLACGHTLHGPVAFPVEELIDWAYFQEGRFDGPHEGGFTIALLRQRYGRAESDGGE